MLTALAIIGVIVLAVAADWNERRCARRIERKMDKLMGRDD